MEFMEGGGFWGGVGLGGGGGGRLYLRQTSPGFSRSLTEASNAAMPPSSKAKAKAKGIHYV